MVKGKIGKHKVNFKRGKWSCKYKDLADGLNMDTFYNFRGDGEDPDQEYHEAERVLKKWGGKITKAPPVPKIKPGMLY